MGAATIEIEIIAARVPSIDFELLELHLCSPKLIPITDACKL